MIYLYKKHPPHNLGGENYPNFRNTSDKNSYCNNFVSTTEYGTNLYVERTSFDTAKIVINGTTPLFNVAGLKEINKGATFYWWIVNWESGAQADSITFYLQLDYWLTYWPLAFNDAIVKIERRHAPRYLKQSDGSFKIAFNVKDGSPHLFNPENEHVAADVPTTIFNLEKWKHIDPVNHQYLSTQIGIALFKGSIKDKTGTIFSFNDIRLPSDITGWAFINGNPVNQSYKDTPNAMINHPTITNVAWVYIKEDAFMKIENMVAPTVAEISARDLSVPFIFKINKDKPVIPTNKIAVITKQFNATMFNVRLKKEVMYFTMKFLASAILLSWWDNWGILTHAVKQGDYIAEYDRSNQQLYINTQYTHNNETYHRRLVNVLPFSDFFTSGIDLNGFNIWWGYENVCTLNNLNEYFRTNPINLKINFTFKKGTDKIEAWDYQRELKVYTVNLKYELIFQRQIHDFNPILLSQIDGLKVSVNYKWHYYAGINNFYSYFEPENSTFSADKQKKFNFICDNDTKGVTFTSKVIEFYMNQGYTFKTGLDQAKWNIDFTKRYNKYRKDNAIANAVLGSLGGALGGAGGGIAAAKGGMKGGAIPIAGGAAAAVGGALGLAGGLTRGIMGVRGAKLANEQAMKQAKYAVKQMESGRLDAIKQPTQTNQVDQQDLAFKLIGDGEPWVQCYAPALQEWITLAYNYHINGHGGTSFEKVNLNAATTRYYFNYWKINNIEQAIIKDTLPMMVVNHFNDLFNKGVRLWNVYNSDVVFNNYLKENWEIDYRESLK